MLSAFRHILIPADFTISTEIAVRRASELIERDNARIWLLHVLRPAAGWKARLSGLLRPGKEARADWKFRKQDAEKKLYEWKMAIEDHLPAVSVHTLLLADGSIEEGIMNATAVARPDLIIIGRQGDRRRFPRLRPLASDQLAQKTNCPVLTVKPGSLHSQTRIIVMPVRDFVPERKLDLAILIARKFRAQVHLLGISDQSSKQTAAPPSAFIDAWHQLKNELNFPVEYFPSKIRNAARAAVEYAGMVKADMILVNPETESGIAVAGGTLHISDLLSRDSRIQVLEVQPYEKELKMQTTTDQC